MKYVKHVSPVIAGKSVTILVIAIRAYLLISDTILPYLCVCSLKLLTLFKIFSLIGTGASCIYPLLGARLNGWQFLATDIDGESVEIARENASRNGLENKIKGEPSRIGSLLSCRLPHLIVM